MKYCRLLHSAGLACGAGALQNLAKGNQKFAFAEAALYNTDCACPSGNSGLWAYGRACTVVVIEI